MRLAVHSPEWHADRRGGIGASDAPIITGDSPWGDVLSLFAVKTGIIDSPNIDTPQTRWGLRLEDVVAEWFTEETGKKLRRVNTRPRHKQYPWMHASLDRRVVGESAVLEIKTARFANDEWGAAWSAEIPAHYLVQVQHEIAVTGVDLAYVAVLFAGSDPRPYKIPRDDALIADLIELESEFWQCVQNGTPPDALIRKQAPVIPLHDGEIEADETLALGIAGVHSLRAEIKERKAELEQAEEAVKTLLGPNTAARAGAYRAIYRPQKDGIKVAHDLIAAAYRKRLAAVDPTFDAESIESLFTRPTPGKRPLLVSLKEEAVNAA
jgi:putative phage-type endonuclease